jgi:hypothetical protein
MVWHPLRLKKLGGAMDALEPWMIELGPVVANSDLLLDDTLENLGHPQHAAFRVWSARWIPKLANEARDGCLSIWAGTAHTG